MNEEKTDIERMLDEIEAEIKRQRETGELTDGLGIDDDDHIVKTKLEESVRRLDTGEREAYAAALLENLTIALNSAGESIDKASERIDETIKQLEDPDRRREIEYEVRLEIAETPYFLDEIEGLTKAPG